MYPPVENDPADSAKLGSLFFPLHFVSAGTTCCQERPATVQLYKRLFPGTGADEVDSPGACWRARQHLSRILRFDPFQRPGVQKASERDDFASVCKLEAGPRDCWAVSRASFRARFSSTNVPRCSNSF